MEVTAAVPIALVVSALAIRFSIPVAPHAGLVDKPGGHKQHEHQTPLVGGLGIFVAVATLLLLGILSQPENTALFGSLLVGSALLFLVGLVDDVKPLSVRLRFSAQAVAASITALWGGILLQDFGSLVSPTTLYLGVMALPITLFAVAGVINALNMVDGVDGLSGSLSFVTLLLLALVAFNGGAQAYLLLTLALLGAVGGFLLFNLRCCRRRRADVFMGDAGSTLLGFLFACLFVGLAQGDDRAMSPVTAIWLFAVPLFDTTAIMVRRVWLRKSPFEPDRTHFHHLLLDAGFTVTQGVGLMAVMQLMLGGIGLVGYYQGVPEYLMFAGFLGLFAVYLFLVSRPWRFVPWLRQLHRNLDLPVAGVTGIFIDGLPQVSGEAQLHKLLVGHLDDYGYELYEHDNLATGETQWFALVHIGCERTAPRVISDLRARVSPGDEVEIHQLVPRRGENDRRKASHSAPGEQRRRDRRSDAAQLIASHPPGATDALVSAPHGLPEPQMEPARVSAMFSERAEERRAGQQ